MDSLGSGLSATLALPLGRIDLDLSIEAAPGETVVVVGPSGGGKTSLLRSLAGLTRPALGRIEIAGRIVFDSHLGIDLPPWKRRTGVVFQDDALLPHLSVEKNVVFGARDRQGRLAAGEWLDLLGLTTLRDRKPSDLSGGERQRTGLARAIASDPDLLLLDEPFGALDITSRRHVRGELRRFLARASGADGRSRPRSTILVSHDPVDALTLGDRVAVLEAGRITHQGKRGEILHRLRSPFLGELAGQNVIEGELAPASHGGSGEREVVAGPIRFVVPAPGDDIRPGTVFLSFAPHEVTIMPARATVSARNQFPATVGEIVPFGGRLRVHLDAGVALTAEVLESAARELALEPGSRVVAAVKSTAIELFA